MKASSFVRLSLPQFLTIFICISLIVTRKQEMAQPKSKKLEVFQCSFSTRGNDFNGWYIEKNWNPGTRNFKYATDMEVEIIP